MDFCRTSVLTFCFFVPGIFAVAQETDDISYARHIVDTLASPAMHGRGYVNNGHKIAADFLAKEFKSIGLKPFTKSGEYFQYFQFPVNTFPKNASVKWKRAGGDPVAGQDYTIGSASPSVKGKFKVEVLDSSVVYDTTAFAAFLKKDLRKCFLIIDTLGVHDKAKLLLLQNFQRYPHGIKGIILPVNYSSVGEHGHECTRLNPWDFSSTQSSYPIIEIARQPHQHLSDIHEIEVRIDAKFIPRQKSQNLIGYIQGTQYPDSFIVFTAHYDHLGQMGRDTYFPGANDNASGVAMLLSLAKYYADPAHQPKCSIAFMAFSAEEVGLIGSQYYTIHPFFPLRQIRFLVNMDILGTGDEGITVVNGTLFSTEFKTMEMLNAQGSYLPLVKIRGKAAISDHYFFTEAGVPCFYIYTLGGIKAYHDVCDKAQTLPLTKFGKLRSLLTDYTDWLDRR